MHAIATGINNIFIYIYIYNIDYYYYYYYCIKSHTLRKTEGKRASLYIYNIYDTKTTRVLLLLYETHTFNDDIVSCARVLCRMST